MEKEDKQKELYKRIHDLEAMVISLKNVSLAQTRAIQELNNNLAKIYLQQRKN